MARGSSKPPEQPTPPQDFAQVPPPPRDLYATSDIRFVMMEIGKLNANVDHRGRTRLVLPQYQVECCRNCAPHTPESPSKVIRFLSIPRLTLRPLELLGKAPLGYSHDCLEVLREKRDPELFNHPAELCQLRPRFLRRKS